MKNFNHASIAARRTWHPVDIPKKVRAARKRFRPRHMADLVCAAGLSWWAVRKWYQAPERYPEWRQCSEGVPCPYRHELDALRYCNNANVAAVQKRIGELIVSSKSHPGAFHTAVDEIIGAARIEGEARRRARRIEKYGHDPVPDKRLTREERAAVKPRRAEYAQRNLERHRKKRRGETRKQRKKRIDTRPGGRTQSELRAYTKELFEARRRAKVDLAMIEMTGIALSKWPRKTPEQLAAEKREEARLNRSEAQRRRRAREKGAEWRV